MYIFLDIDGVLVKEDAPGKEIDLDEDFMKYDEGCLNIFESVIRRVMIIAKLLFLLHG